MSDQRKCEWRYNKWIKELCTGKKPFIKLKQTSWCVFLSCWQLYGLSLSHNTCFQCLGWTGTLNEEWQVTSMPQGCWLASFDENHYRNKLKSISISVIIWANISWVKIPNYQLNDIPTLSPITARIASSPGMAQFRLELPRSSPVESTQIFSCDGTGVQYLRTGLE